MADFPIQSDESVLTIARLLVGHYAGKALQIATGFADDNLVAGNYARAALWSEVMLAIGSLVP